MSNLTSTQPGAFDAFLSLLQTAGAAATPKVTVLDSEVVQYEPAAYCVLTGFDHHRFDDAALGSFAFYEYFDLVGFITYMQGDVDPKTVRDTTFSLYQSVVQTTVVTNRGQPFGNPVLGSNAPPQLEVIVPTYARYSSGPANFSGGAAGFFGQIDFAYSLRSRITAA